MLKNTIKLLALFFYLPIAAQVTDNNPKLVVGIVVDQMRWDYLYRFQDRYTTGGFNRLMKEGYSNENTYTNYIHSYWA